MELGGNIKLDGFQTVDSPSLIIVKKMVGNCVKKLQQENASFQEFLLKLESSSPISISAKLTTTERNCNASASDINLFFAINKALEEILAKSRKEPQQDL